MVSLPIPGTPLSGAHGGQYAGAAVEFSLGIDQVQTGTDAEVLVDAVGDVRVDVEGEQFGVAGNGATVEVLGVLGGSDRSWRTGRYPRPTGRSAAG